MTWEPCACVLPGSLTFTAEAEMELQRQPESLPGSGIQTYEMRGLITLISPLQISHNSIHTTCQILKSVVRVRISADGPTLSLGDEEFPKKSYEIRLFQEVPLGECVSSDGRHETIPFHNMEVNSDSAQMAIDGRPSQTWTPQTLPKPLTPAEQTLADEQVRIAEAMTSHPAMRQGLPRSWSRGPSARDGRSHGGGSLDAHGAAGASTQRANQRQRPHLGPVSAAPGALNPPGSDRGSAFRSFSAATIHPSTTPAPQKPVSPPGCPWRSPGGRRDTHPRSTRPGASATSPRRSAPDAPG